MSNTKTFTKVLAAIAILLGSVGPAIAPFLRTWVSGHPVADGIISTAAVVLALFHQPSVSA